MCPGHRRDHRSRKIRLEHAGYRFEHDTEVWELKRPDRDIIGRYTHLGHALNRAEKDIALARGLLGLQSMPQYRYWSDILEKYDESGTSEFWAARQE